ncbi:hypothetical protein Tco_0158640 [Tanacetum coccineum]
MWKPTRNTPPLPPIVKTMPGRPRKSRIKHHSEQEHEHSISRASRVMTCQQAEVGGQQAKLEGQQADVGVQQAEVGVQQAEVGVNKQRNDIQAERGVMQETMLEERRKQEEREHNGRIYTEWDDLMVNSVSEREFMDTRPTLSELAVVDEVIAEHNEGLPSNSQDLGSPHDTNGQSSVGILAMQVVPSQSSVEFVQDVPAVQIVPSQPLNETNTP